MTLFYREIGKASKFVFVSIKLLVWYIKVMVEYWIKKVFDGRKVISLVLSGENRLRKYFIVTNVNGMSLNINLCNRVNTCQYKLV